MSCRNLWAQDLLWVFLSDMSDRAADGDSGATTSVVHASCVALDGAGVLILGASGRGKSGLALQMMALGAGLVADDRTVLQVVAGPDSPQLVADAPDALRGRIEARGVGILHAEACSPCKIALIVDLDSPETDRLPPMRQMVLLGVTLPLLHMVDTVSFPAAILQYLKHGRFA